MGKINDFFEKTRNFIICFILMVAGSVGSALIVHYNWPSRYAGDYAYEVFRDRTELHEYDAKNDLVQAVDNYIDSIAPNSCLNGLRLVEICDEYNFDIKFALAQGQLESHFGTEGIAAKTNMVWNVKAYDGKSAEAIIKDGDGKPHPDESIEPYIQCLYKTYLVNGKTEKDMFIKFVDVNGKRYASNPNYEDSLLHIYDRIEKETQLNELIDKFNKYKIICGK